MIDATTAVIPAVEVQVRERPEGHPNSGEQRGQLGALSERAEEGTCKVSVYMSPPSLKCSGSKCLKGRGTFRKSDRFTLAIAKGMSR